jgi:parallel beta-helix repeat protein
MHSSSAIREPKIQVMFARRMACTPRNRPVPRRGHLATLTIVVFAGLSLTACGGSEPTAKQPTKITPTETTAAETAATAPTETTAAETAATETKATEPATTETTRATVAPRPPRTIRVPSDQPTIQAAVDASVEGDLILIAPGTYREAVDVFTNDLTIRGEDRNTVILDGADELENGFKVAADRVAIENLTVQRYTFNGLLFTMAYDDNVEDPTQHKLVNGYRAAYINAANNGQYGIYAFFARGGDLNHIYASGHPDSGIYVGQCKPCDATLSDITAEQNSIGYQGTNASGNLFIVNSMWRNNRIGLTPNSQNMERLAPQGDVVIAGNIVESNNSAAAPATAQGGFGVGIAVAGGNRNRVTKNLIRNNAQVGITVTDLNGYVPEGNQISENALSGNGVDLTYVDEKNSPSIPARANCFAKNQFERSIPVAIESVLPCDSTPTGGSDGPVDTGPVTPIAAPPDIDYRTVPLPPRQPSMDNPAGPATVVSDTPPPIDLAAITLPSEPS